MNNFLGQTNGTTAVEIVAANAGGAAIEIKQIIVHNTDTVAADVLILLNNDGQSFQIHKCRLLADESMFYEIALKLIDPSMSIEAKLGAVVTTNELTIYADWTKSQAA